MSEGICDLESKAFKFGKIFVVKLRDHIGDSNFGKFGSERF